MREVHQFTVRNLLEEVLAVEIMEYNDRNNLSAGLANPSKAARCKIDKLQEALVLLNEPEPEARNSGSL